MHILFFISDISSKGGTERISFKVANHLVKEGHKVSFASWKTEEDSLKFELDESIAIFHLSSSTTFSKLSILKNIVKLRGLISNQNVDVLVDVDSVLTPYSFISIFTKNIKHVVWEHFNAGINLGVKRRDFGRRIAAKYADQCIVLTNEDKQLWETKFKAKNVQVIYNPVTIPLASHIVPITDKKIVLAVGRLAEQKGFDLLLKAWNLIDLDTRGNAILQIAGTGELELDLKKLATELNISESVQFYGYASDISTLYNQAYCYVLSSRFEGFVLSLTEAMGAGLPVISFDCPCGPKELLVNNSGIIVPKEDINKLSESMATMLQDKEYRNSLAENALRRSSDFTDEKLLPLWSELFEELS